MEKDLEHCYKTLREGGIILYPTDTIWGIGCDATNQKAVERIFNIKLRHESKSMIILLDDILKLDFYIDEVPAVAYDLIDQYKNPLTIIYPNAKNIAKNCIADDGSIGIRIVKDEFCKRLINIFDKPIVSTSANISGEVTPISYPCVSEKIIEKMDYIVQYGQDSVEQFKASTIIKISDKATSKSSENKF
jgi:L-threonylcarbamoyladenylate synthase